MIAGYQFTSTIPSPADNEAPDTTQKKYRAKMEPGRRASVLIASYSMSCQRGGAREGRWQEEESRRETGRVFWPEKERKGLVIRIVECFVEYIVLSIVVQCV